MRRALEVSSDVYFYKLGAEMNGTRQLQDWAGDFGLGKATGIDIPGESEGLVPTPKWLNEAHKEEPKYYDPWVIGQNIQFAIGQGYFQASPLQMAVAYSALGNGGTVQDVHPLLATRGPPGTHDLALACATLDALRRGDARLPRFDKLTDTRRPPSRWRHVQARPDLIVFEGWLLGLAPQSVAQLENPINALEREQDADGGWRRWCNMRLADYAALWRRFDRLLYLQAPSFAVVPDWRAQQERALAADRSLPGMSRAGIERFVQHYERLTRHGMKTLPGIADRVVRLDDAHRVAPVSARNPADVRKRRS